MMQDKAKLSVMLVEDDLAHAEITLRSIEELAPEPCNVLHLVDGQDALDRLHSATSLPDLVLLDLRLPRMAGPDAELSQIPVVVLTTSDADADRKRALACGASSYLVKPFGENELQALTRMLGCESFCSQRAPSV